MSLNEILAELPKLKAKESETILLRIEELNDRACPEMLAAIDQADALPGEQDLPAENLRQMVKAWAHTR